jgi:hypothetical protein
VGLTNTVICEAKNYSFLIAIAVSILDKVLYSKYVNIYIYTFFTAILLNKDTVCHSSILYVNKDIVFTAKYVLLEI